MGVCSMAKNEHAESVIKWVTITVLIAVSLFFAVVYKSVFIDKNKIGLNEGDKISTEITNGEKSPTNNDNPPTPPPKVDYSVFPRNSKEYINSQNRYAHIGGNKNDYVKNVIELKDFYFLVCQTNSNGDDFSATRQSIAIAKLQLDGTLIKTYTIPFSEDEYYLNSKRFGNNIFIASKSNNTTNFYQVNSDLTVNKLNLQTQTNSLNLYYTPIPSQMVCIGVNGKNMYIKVVDNTLCIKHSYAREYAENDIKIFNIFTNIAGYSVVMKRDTTNYISNFNFEGNFLNEYEISKRELIKIIPCREGYNVLEKSGEDIIFRTIDNINYQNVSYIDEVVVGQGINADFYNKKNGSIIFIYSNNSNTKVYHYHHGVKISDVSANYSKVKKVSYFVPVIKKNTDKLYLLTETTDGTKLFIYNENLDTEVNNICSINGNYHEECVKLIVNDTSFNLFINTDSNDNYFSENFGETDIYFFNISKN